MKNQKGFAVLGFVVARYSGLLPAPLIFFLGRPGGGAGRSTSEARVGTATPGERVRGRLNRTRRVNKKVKAWQKSFRVGEEQQKNKTKNAGPRVAQSRQLIEKL